MDGYLEFSFDLGSGPVVLQNRKIKINDGNSHTVVLKRNGKRGSIEIDQEHIVEGENKGLTNQMNCNGNIYLGNQRYAFVRLTLSNVLYQVERPT